MAKRKSVKKFPKKASSRKLTPEHKTYFLAGFLALVLLAAIFFLGDRTEAIAGKSTDTVELNLCMDKNVKGKCSTDARCVGLAQDSCGKLLPPGCYFDTFGYSCALDASSCLDKFVKGNCATDAECLSLAEEKCGSLLDKGCQFDYYGGIDCGGYGN